MNLNRLYESGLISKIYSSRIFDYAAEKSLSIHKCAEQGKEVLIHLLKVILIENEDSRDHFLDEIYGFLSNVVNTKLGCSGNPYINTDWIFRNFIDDCTLKVISRKRPKFISVNLIDSFIREHTKSGIPLYDIDYSVIVESIQMFIDGLYDLRIRKKDWMDYTDWKPLIESIIEYAHRYIRD